MEVSIIIVNYNTKKLLYNCLLSIYNKTSDTTFEIIVVDNDSIDGSREMIKSSFPDVILIESQVNLGFGKANNEGARIARGKFIFLLNSDTLLINNAINILSTFLNEHSNVAICGGNLYTSDLKPATSFSQTMPGVFSDIDYFFGGIFSRIKYGKNLNFNYTNKPLELGGYISGADLMIRKDVFLELNGFDPDFFMYYEETELTFRVKANGNRKVASVPSAKIIHLEGASELIKERSAIRSFESKLKYYNKTGMTNKIFVSHILFKLTAIQRILIFSILGRKAKAKYWKNLLRWESNTYKSSL